MSTSAETRRPATSRQVVGDEGFAISDRILKIGCASTRSLSGFMRSRLQRAASIVESTRPCLGLRREEMQPEEENGDGKHGPRQQSWGPRLDHFAGGKYGSGGASASHRWNGRRAPLRQPVHQTSGDRLRLRGVPVSLGEHGNRDGEGPGGSFPGQIRQSRGFPPRVEAQPGQRRQDRERQPDFLLADGGEEKRVVFGVTEGIFRTRS